MDESRTINALERIEKAVTRIEHAKALTGDPAMGLRLTHLGARHDKLKQEAEMALTSLDALIDKLSQPEVPHG